jgi:release factor glutamine methyltransferase
LSGEHYLYSQDSELLGSAISELRNGETFLEIGVGRASNLKAISKKFNLAVGTDLRIPPDLDPGKTGIELIVADRATCFRRESFDIVVFNPPYLPSEDIVDRTVDGGRGGIEVPLRFLSSALEVVKNEGKILTLLSSENSLESFVEFCKVNGLSFTVAKERRLFFETLYVFLIVKEDGRPIKEAGIQC